MNNQLFLQPVLAVLVKLRVELQLESKELTSVNYAIWDMVRTHHTCNGISARQVIQLVLGGNVFYSRKFPG